MKDLKKKNIEVIFLYTPVDEFVMGSIGSFEKHTLKSIERTELPEKEETKEGLSPEEVKELENWYTDIMKGKLSSVKSTTRLSGTPAIISNPENPAMRLMRKMYGDKKRRFRSSKNGN